MTKPEPARYRTTNWKSYNDALKQRGSLLIWLDKDMAWCGVQPHNSGSWNLADTRTCTDVAQRGHTQYHDMLEVHEFAHMLGLPDVYLDASRDINGALFRTRGDIGSAADDIRMTSTPASPIRRMLGSMQDTSDYDKSYALTVARVVTRHMHEVWGHGVEDWEILT